MSADTRFFAADAETYERVRLALDAAWGHPSERARTCYRPLAEAVRDNAGRALLGVRSTFCQYPAVAAVLPSLLASGVVKEITRAEYEDAMPKGFP